MVKALFTTSPTINSTGLYSYSFILDEIGGNLEILNSQCDGKCMDSFQGELHRGLAEWTGLEEKTINTLDTVHYTLYTLHCTLYTTNYTLHTIHCPLYTTYYTLHITHCLQYTTNYTMHTTRCLLYTTNCALHTEQCKLYTAH